MSIPVGLAMVTFMIGSSLHAFSGFQPGKGQICSNLLPIALADHFVLGASRHRLAEPQAVDQA
jgi:hypothetical protein